MRLLPIRAGASVLPTPAVVAVTGASSGIGLEVARHLAGEGHHVVLVARDEDALEEATESCREAGAASAQWHAVDVASDEQVRGLVDTILETHDRLDGAVHCAGEVTYGRHDATEAAIFDRVISTNVTGTANLARHVVATMRAQGSGSLVLVGSLLGHVAVPEMTPYVVSKWAVRALARQLHVECLDVRDLHISHVAPGSVDTPIYDRALESAGTVNRPPPPTISPELAARRIVRVLHRPRPTAQTAWSNHALRLAFTAAPAIYDRTIGPVFKVASRRTPEGDERATPP